MGRRRLLEIRLSRWRDPLDSRDPRFFAPWLRELAGHAGVYAIRDNDSARVFYVGGSGGKGGSRGDLYTIITRHLQQSMNRGGRRPAGTYYERGAVEIAFVLSGADEAPELERVLIEALRPADNLRLVGVELDSDDPTEEEIAAAVAELEGMEAPF